MTDEGNFKDGLISRIITEVGMDKEQATELADILSKQMTKIILAERSQIVDSAIKKAQEVLANNKVKPKANQRTILQKLVEMANMGVLDSEMVYEAFRQTHEFPKNFMPYDAEFTNTLREWGDRISKLPAGVIRSIEEEKMGRALMNKSKFTADDVLSSYWYFSLISQASTSAINAMAGANNLIANVAVWSIYNPKSFFPMVRAMYSAVAGTNSAAVNSFLYVMRNGLNPSGMQDEKRAKYPKTNVLEGATPENTPKIVYYLTNFGDGKINFLPDWMNTALKNVNPRQLMRLLRATDMFLREVAYEAKAAQLGAAAYTREGFDMAKRQAELELASSQATGKQKDQEIIIRANEIYREQRLADEGQRAIAEQASLETAFNQEPQGLFGMLANFVNGLLAKYPATKFVIPFTNVVANVTNEFLNYTPIFSQYRLIRAKKSGMKDPFTQGRADKEYEIQMKGILGILAMVPFIIQALTGGDEEDQEKRPYIQFYAEGPKDPRQKKIWQQRGGQKYSVRVGDTYFSYLYTPLVIPLASGAMLQEEIKSMRKKGEKLQAEDIGKLAASAITAPFSIGFVAVLNQSFLTGLADLLEFKESQNPVEKGTQFVGGIISRMLVPGAFRDINKLYTESHIFPDTLNPEIETSYIRVNAQHGSRIHDPRNLPAMVFQWSEQSSRRAAQQELSELVARECTRLVGEGANIEDRHTRQRRALHFGDIAVLCYGHHELRIVRRTLTEAGIPCQSSGTGLGSVFDSAEASDVHAWLRLLSAISGHGAVLNKLLAFEGTPLGGAEAKALISISRNPQDQAARCAGFQREAEMLQRLGPLAAMLKRLDNSFVIASNLGFAEGERRYTNWRHIAGLLQQEHARGRRGPRALEQWLGRQIARGTSSAGSETLSGESALMKIETDSAAVQMVTVHGAKGLEYPVVFCPFLWHLKSKRERLKKKAALFRTRKEWCIDVGSSDFDENLAASTADMSNATYIDVLSNGFKLRTTSLAHNTSNAAFLFAAFAEVPFNYALAR